MLRSTSICTPWPRFRTSLCCRPAQPCTDLVRSVSASDGSVRQQGDSPKGAAQGPRAIRRVWVSHRIGRRLPIDAQVIKSFAAGEAIQGISMVFLCLKWACAPLFLSLSLLAHSTRVAPSPPNAFAIAASTGLRKTEQRNLRIWILDLGPPSRRWTPEHLNQT